MNHLIPKSNSFKSKDVDARQFNYFVFLTLFLFLSIVSLMFAFYEQTRNRSQSHADSDPNLTIDGQYKSDGTTPIYDGWWTNENSINIKGTYNDPENENYILEAEVISLTTPFDNIANFQSTEVAAGTQATIVVNSLTNNDRYHWQVRACDINVNCTDWVYGNNTEYGKDFGIDQNSPDTDDNGYTFQNNSGLNPVNELHTVQGNMSVINDGSNGYYILDAVDNEDLTYSLYLQHFDFTNTPHTNWTSTGIQISNNIYYSGFIDLGYPKMILDSNGGVYITWSNKIDSNLNDIRLIRIDSNGVIHTGWPSQGVIIGNKYNATVPKIKMGANNFIYVGYIESSSSLNRSAIRVQKLDTDGNAIWTDNGIYISQNNSINGITNFQMDYNQNSDDIFFGWQAVNTYYNIKSQGIDSDGNAMWTDNGILLEGNSFAYRTGPEIVSDNVNGCVLTWFSDNHTNLQIQRVDGSGNLIWGSGSEGTDVEGGTGVNSIRKFLLRDNDGNFFALWTTTNPTMLSASYSVYVQKFDIDGIALWGSNAVQILTEIGTSELTDAVHDGNGGVILMWLSSGNGERGVSLVHLNSDGEVITEHLYDSTGFWYPRIIYNGLTDTIIYINQVYVGYYQLLGKVISHGNTSGSITYNDGIYETNNIIINLSAGTDSQSGVDESISILERRSRQYINGNCENTGSYQPVFTGPPSQYTDNNVSPGNCYSYRYVVVDYAGNSYTYSSANTYIIPSLDENNPPVFQSLQQVIGESNTEININTWMNVRNIKFRTIANDPESTPYTLQIEYKPVGENFTDTPHATSEESGSGDVAFVEINDLSPGIYHWQAQVCDQTNVCSGWQSFGDNLESDFDFGIDINPPSGGTINYTSGSIVSPLQLNLNPGIDDISGVSLASSYIERGSRARINNSCSGSYTYTTLPNSYNMNEYIDNSLELLFCYNYRYRVFDNANNSTIYTSSNEIYLVSNLSNTSSSGTSSSIGSSSTSSTSSISSSSEISSSTSSFNSTIESSASSSKPDIPIFDSGQNIEDSILNLLPSTGNPALDEKIEEAITFTIPALKFTSLATFLTLAWSVLNTGLLTKPDLTFSGIPALFIRRKQKYIGIVYDVDSYKSIPFAVVRAYDQKSGAMVSERVTDTKGRYSFFLNNGVYIIEVFHNDYEPFSLQLKIDNLNLSANLDVPLIRKKYSKYSLFNILNHIRFFFKSRIQLILKLLFVIGYPTAIISVLINPTILNIGNIALYIFISIVYIYYYLVQPKNWGYVYDSENGQEIRNAFVRLFDSKENKLIDTQLTDENGRYGFIVEPGEYLLLANAPGYKFPSTKSNSDSLVKTFYGSLLRINIKNSKFANAQLPMDKSNDDKNINKLLSPFHN